MENTEKYKIFSVPIEKVATNIDKDGNKSVVTISYKIKFIDTASFMATSLSNVVDNITEGLHKVTFKYCDCFLQYESVKDKLMKYKCLALLHKSHSNKIDEELKKKFKNTFKFSDNDINKYVLLLRKSVYPYEYIEDEDKFNETTLPKKEKNYSNLNMEDITNADYIHAKRVCKDFEIKYLGEYHDLYLKSDSLILSDVFKNFSKMCLKFIIYIL